MQGSRAILAVVLVVGVLLIVFTYPVQAFTRDYLEVAYIDKSFNLNSTQVKEAAFKVLSGFVDWNRVVYSRVFVLNINGAPILYAKAFMVPYTPVTTTCTVVTVTTTPVTVVKECKTITSTAPLNTGFTYYPTSNGMVAVYVKAELSLEGNNIVGVKVLDHYTTILGKEVWDPVAIGNIVAQSVWESQATVEAVVRAVIAEHLEPREIWLSTSELVYPPEHILSVIFLADDYIYGVIYDWGQHRILAVGLDIIEPPYYLPGQQHSVPTTTITTIQPTGEPKNATVPATTLTIITYPTTTRPIATETRMPQTTTVTPVTTVTATYGSAETRVTQTTTQPTATTLASIPTTQTTMTGEGRLYEIRGTETSSMTSPISGLRTLNATTLTIVAISAIVVALLSWLIIRRVLV